MWWRILTLIKNEIAESGPVAFIIGIIVLLFLAWLVWTLGPVFVQGLCSAYQANSPKPWYCWVYETVLIRGWRWIWPSGSKCEKNNDLLPLHLIDLGAMPTWVLLMFLLLLSSLGLDSCRRLIVRQASPRHLIRRLGMCISSCWLIFPCWQAHHWLDRSKE